MTIPKLTPYTGQVANPDGSQTQTEFTQNMFDQLSYEAQLATELDATIDGMNQAVTDVEGNANAASASATAAEASASTAGYKGLWPDTGGSADKGDTYQTQVGGTPTGEYYTALQNTTVDPVGDNVNWKVNISAGDVRNPNLLSNGQFKFASPDDSLPAPSATPQDYPAGFQIFSGWFADDVNGASGVTRVNDILNWTQDGVSSIYTLVPKDGDLTEYTASLAGKVSGAVTSPDTSHVSFSDNGDGNWRITIANSATDIYSCKFEQGSVATGHDVGGWNEITQWRLQGDIRGWGAVGDYYLSDGSINPSPTDNSDAIKAALASGGNILGLSLTAPHGGFYCSEAIKVDYQTNNPWLGQSGIGRLSIKGKGIGSTVFIFPSSENDGMLVNTDSMTITNLDIGGFSLVREGFNPDNYQPRPYHEDFNFSSEPLYGEGLHVRHNGYLGGLEDIMISGFYVAFKQSNVYNGSIKRIFTPQGKAIYGFIGQLNTTLRAVDCNFWGYQASWVSSGGSNELQNIVCEGNMTAFEANPNLVDKFAGHSFYQSGGRLNMTGCYTEKSIGFARGLVNCIYFETDGTVSNGLKYHYNSTGSDGLSGALKAKIDIVNPNFISTYCQVTSSSRPQSTVMNSYMTINDVHWLEDSTIGDKVYTNIYSIEGCIPTYNGWENTINSVFINQIPSNLQMGESVNTWQAQQYQRPTNFNGSVGVINDYDPNYNGYGTFTVGRLTRAGDRIAKTGIKWNMDLGGNSKLTNFAIDSSGLSLWSNDSITILASGSVSFHLNLLPEVDSTGNIGTSSRRWSNIYVVNAPIVGSDARLKDFFDVEDHERAAAIEIKSSIRKYKWNYKDKDDSRFHFGVSAQEVCEILRKHNLDPMAYSFVCYDELEDSQSDDLTSSYQDRYGIRYSEMCMFILSAI